MRQDGRRSVGYRPFFTCYDPRDVVECGTIRKSDRCNYQKMEPSSEGRLRPRSLNRAADGKELSRASIQLLEVSKGAQKLNPTIKPWSKGMNVEGKPKDISKDLLKGALDLQESLMMLEKLKLASRYVARLKPKQKKSVNSVLPINLFHGQVIEFSRNKTEELKEVVSNGLVRQNWLDERRSQPHGPHSQIPFTSSNSSSSVSYNGSRDAAPDKKASSPNIRSKLMALEEISSKPVQRKLQDKKILQQQKHKFNVSVPQLKKKLESEVMDDEPYQGTLKEMLNSVQFKGLLDNSIRGTPVIYADDVPPTVLIKPSCHPCPESTEAMLEGKRASGPITVLKGLTTSDKFPCKTVDRGKIVSDTERIQEAPRLKEILGIDSCQRRGSMGWNEETSTPEKAWSSQRASNKSRHPSPPTKEQVKREKHGKISGETEKVKKCDRNSLEKANSKAKSIHKSEDQVKTNALAVVKPKDRPNCVKRDVSPQGTRNSRQDHSEKEISTLEMQRNKKNKEVAVAKLDKNVADQKEDGTKIDTTLQNSIINLETATGNEEQQQITSGNSNASEAAVGATEICSDIKSSLAVISPSTLEFGAEIDGQKLNLEGFEAGDCIKSLLLSSPSFLSYAQDCSAFVSTHPVLLQKPTTKADSISLNERLLAEYVDEFMECRTSHALVGSSLIVGIGSLRTQVSIDYLFEEILNGIENLSSYCRFASESLIMDSLDSLLKRDLYLHRGAAKSRLWAAGWTKGFCFEDAEQFVKELEENIFSSLVEEAVVELVQ